MFYFDTPNYSVALNAKVASSSMARAIIAQFQPRADWLIRTAKFPPGVTADDRQWHFAARGSHTPSKPVVLLVREPVARFVTACQQVRIHQGDIDAAIASLANDIKFVRTKPVDMTQEQWDAAREKRASERLQMDQKRQQRIAAGKPVREPINRSSLRHNVHFFHQQKYIVGPTTCFRFPRDIAAAAAFIGITTPLPEANKAKRRKPTLTPEQEAAVVAYYAADVALFESIASPGTVITPSDNQGD
jgi:hypothetical protein